MTAQKEIKKDLRNSLCEKKEKDLQTDERTNATITKDLYWKFDAACREGKYKAQVVFGDWLKQYRTKSDTKLARFKEDVAARNAVIAERNKSRTSVASLRTVETRLLNVADGLKPHHSMEVRKSLVALRKSAERAGHAAGALVTKENFDQHLENVLAPILKLLPQDIKGLAMDPLRKSREGGLESSPQSTYTQDIFFATHGEAAKHAVLTDKENSSKTTEFFDRWVQAKDAEVAAKKDRRRFERGSEGCRGENEEGKRLARPTSNG